MDLENCLTILYQASRQAPMPADAHIACFQAKEALAALVKQSQEATAGAKPGPEGQPH